MNKELKMSTKTLLKLGIAFGAVALLMIFLGGYFVPRVSAGNKANTETITRLAVAGAIRSLLSNYYINSDWIERHPSSGGLETILGQSSKYYINSDWIERHPSNYYTGSDWIERHPSNYYAGADWIERHPVSPVN